VIVVDDASTDGTSEFLESKSFKVPLRVIRLEQNSGPSAARNTGIAHASGKYVALLDSDDYWLPGKLAGQVEAAERSSGPDRILIYSASVIVRRNETVVRPRRGIGEAEPIADYLFCNGGFLCPSAVMVSSAMARAVPFPVDLRLHEDWDWYIRLQERGTRFVMVPEAGCVFDDRATEGRASQPNPTASLAVAAQWKSVISRCAYLAFVARIAPHLRGTASLRAARLILAAYAVGAIGTWQLASLLGRLVHPDLREWAYRFRALGSRARGKTIEHGGGLPRRLRALKFDVATNLVRVAFSSVTPRVMFAGFSAIIVIVALTTLATQPWGAPTSRDPDQFED
jgi:glycosyltransferase involved in cell wall biosynthesis